MIAAEWLQAVAKSQPLDCNRRIAQPTDRISAFYRSRLIAAAGSIATAGWQPPDCSRMLAVACSQPPSQSHVNTTNAMGYAANAANATQPMRPM